MAKQVATMLPSVTKAKQEIAFAKPEVESMDGLTDKELKSKAKEHHQGALAAEGYYIYYARNAGEALARLKDKIKEENANKKKDKTRWGDVLDSLGISSATFSNYRMIYDNWESIQEQFKNKLLGIRDVRLLVQESKGTTDTSTAKTASVTAKIMGKKGDLPLTDDGAERIVTCLKPFVVSWRKFVSEDKAENRKKLLAFVENILEDEDILGAIGELSKRGKKKA